MMLSRKNIDSDLKGYLAIPNQIMMVVAIGVTDSKKAHPPLGVMVTARAMSPEIVAKLGAITRLDLDLLTVEQVNKDPGLRRIMNTINHNISGHLIVPLSEESLVGFSIIRDLYQKPIGMFRMTIPRSIYTTGKRAINYYLASIILLGFLFTILMSAMIHRLIVRRLEQLDKTVAEISSTNKLSRRVETRGNDELSSVSHQINRLLGMIETSQEKLEQRVQKRTQALQKTNLQLELEIIHRRSIEKELIQNKEYLVQMAHYDILTSLPNRILFSETLDRILQESSDATKQLALFFIDLDRFKTINDALGHHAGDIVLKEIASRVSTLISPDTVFARLGGDEFIILLHDKTGT